MSIFWNSKMSQLTKVRWFQPDNAPKACGGRAPPLQRRAPPDPLGPGSLAVYKG